jgi:hypothetical protein
LGDVKPCDDGDTHDVTVLPVELSSPMPEVKPDSTYPFSLEQFRGAGLDDTAR